MKYLNKQSCGLQGKFNQSSTGRLILLAVFTLGTFALTTNLMSSCGGKRITNVKIQEAAEELSVAQCERYIRCCGNSPTYKTNKECETAIRGDWDKFINTNKPLVDNGQLVYHSGSVKDLVNAYREANCDQEVDRSPQIFTPKIDLQQPCVEVSDFQVNNCLNGYCAPADNDSSKKVCKNAALPNTNCQDTAQSCVNEYYCNPDNLCVKAYEKKLHEACKHDKDCRSGACSNNQCAVKDVCQDFGYKTLR